MKKGIVALLITAAIPFFVFAYVSPGAPSGFVNDFAGILSTAQKSELETTLSNFEKETSAEVVIVTIQNLGGEDPVVYGVKLFEEWGIGKEGKDNGLLILHALDERQIRIEVGYGLEGVITDAKASAVYRNILSPAFKENRYGDGYVEAVKAITATIRGEADAIPQGDNSKQVSVDWFFLLLFVPLWLASILGRSKSWWLGGVLGGFAGVVIGLVYSFWFLPVLIVAGLIFDFIVSKIYHSRVDHGRNPPWWIGGGHGGFGGGFGGFGGGGSGGGGGGGGY